MGHTASAAPFAFSHSTRIGKGGVNKFGISCQWRSELFLVSSFIFTIRKAMINDPRLWKEYLTGIGQGAMFADFPIVKEN
jgi:hypothetical protein